MFMSNYASIHRTGSAWQAGARVNAGMALAYGVGARQRRRSMGQAMSRASPCRYKHTTVMHAQRPGHPFLRRHMYQPSKHGQYPLFCSGRTTSTLNAHAHAPKNITSRRHATSTRQGFVRNRYLAILLACGLVYMLDEHVYASTLQRNLRTVYTGIRVIIDYKLRLHADGDNVDEIHQRVAQRILDTCLRNGGLYVVRSRRIENMHAF